MLRWFEQIGKCSDVVLSSRVRLARNLNQYCFSHKISEDESEALITDVKNSLSKERKLKGYQYIDLRDIEEIQKEAYCERHVISSFLKRQPRGAAYVSMDERMAIMVNEEDHVRIQSFMPGMDIYAAFEAANEMDDMLAKKLDYAYDENFGYLTTCPSNVGTGMKASYTLHLPALSNSRKIQGLVSELGHFGLAIRPVYSNKGNAEAHLYQIYNQRTLGQTEEEILENLSSIVSEIIEQERKGRQYFIRKERLRIEDEVYKSYGLLCYSRKMSLSDARLLLSRLRMGIACDLIRLSEEQPLCTYQMLMGIMPANLSIAAGTMADEQELDVLRASFIRENIPLLS